MAMIMLVLISVAMGITGLLAFLWSVNAKQYDDLDGAAVRILLDDNDEIG
ncbi:cytochrome C oxidase Cbb3 [Rhizobium sp. Root274]|jgi:cbb3-type cytochrome oxidase maturation protein|nr:MULTISPECIES: cbb3-type cytochrome oxidase assembly protein CcoS [Rhizobium]KQW25482.1 cytochrome C oxidase Cbb3 [Rhizobium sp. Root1240]KRD26102.1 cytochrome C oxidase Cbb3 [Rhizobium sp. Root274]